MIEDSAVLKLLSRSTMTLALVPLGFMPPVAQADDVGFGVGISYVFGSGLAVGARAFSNDEDNETVGSVGIDYLISAGAFRPNVGIAYQGEGYFSGVSVGYNLGAGVFDFGVGLGLSNGDDRNQNAASAPTPAFTPAPAPTPAPPPPPSNPFPF